MDPAGKPAAPGVDDQAMLRISMLVAALLVGLVLVLASRGEAEEPRVAATGTLTDEDRALWGTAPSDPGEIPVLLYHGIDERDGFTSAAAVVMHSNCFSSRERATGVGRSVRSATWYSS